jgi:nucleoside-diphosphate-sugar epimerase
MVRIVREAAPCVVFHLASLFLSQHTSDDVERLIQSNVLLGTQLAEAMSVCGVKRLLNTGTSWQHYQNQDYSPVNLYAATKQAFEDVLQYYVEAAGLQVITLKLFDTYGPNDPRPKLLQLLSHASREGKPLDMSPGEQSIDLVHIDDVVEAFGIAARRLLNEQVTGHESYAVGSGQAMRLQDVVMVFESAAGVKVPVRWGRRPYRVREVMVPADNLERLPGWSPRIKLEDGLRESIAGNKAVHPRSLDETGK